MFDIQLNNLFGCSTVYVWDTLSWTLQGDIKLKHTWFTFWRHKQTQCYSCKSILLEKKIVKKNGRKKKTSQPPPCLWVAFTLVVQVAACSFVLISYSNFEILSSSIWSANFWRLDVDTKKFTVDLQVAMTTWKEARVCSPVPLSPIQPC